jgi:hypothetical protein
MLDQRFGFLLIEVWGMTEILRVLLDHEPPRASRPQRQRA